MALTAGAPLPVLAMALCNSGRGDLRDPALRALPIVLLALSQRLDPRSATGKTTAPQIADFCGYSERWVRRTLGLMVELGLVEWERGGIVNGAPVASWFRVCKRTLLDLIQIARSQKDQVTADRRAATRRRAAALRTSYTRPGRPTRDRKRPRRARGGVHAELSPTLPPYGEVSSAHGAGRGALDTGETSKKDDAVASTTTAQAVMARIRADLAANRGRGRGEKRSNEPRAGRGVGVRLAV